jgi:hypothetical protein
MIRGRGRESRKKWGLVNEKCKRRIRVIGFRNFEK